MSTKTLNGNYPGGYTIVAAVTDLTITPITYVGGPGVVDTFSSVRVTNLGKIGAGGIYLAHGGTIFNGSASSLNASVIGNYGAVELNGPGTVTNFGSILSADKHLMGDGAVILDGGGTVINQTIGTHQGLIEGYQAVVAGVFPASLMNYGQVIGLGAGGYDAVSFAAGGLVSNGSATDTSALIEGPGGVNIDGYSNLNNFGTILALADEGAVFLDGGSTVRNGSAGDKSALMEGASGLEIFNGSASVHNFGSIIGTGDGYATVGSSGVELEGGGILVNGAVTDTSALISGYDYGIDVTLNQATVTNYGVVVGGDKVGIYVSSGGGLVRNGAGGDTAATIDGFEGIYCKVLETVVNFGSIHGRLTNGIFMLAGGTITNGSASSTAALTDGETGVLIKGGSGGVINNFGSIKGSFYVGAYLGATGGAITNGGGTDRTALIQGPTGLQIVGLGTVRNFGTILGTGAPGSYAVAQQGGGSFQNGSATNTTALISGYNGAALTQVLGENFGTILALGDVSGTGLNLFGGAVFANGGSSAPGALIEGYQGVGVYANSEFANFGTVVGEGGVAVRLASSSAVLDVAPNSVFVGQIMGDYGALELAAGVGTITGLFTNVATVSGSMAPTQFQKFGSVQIDSGASFTLAGNTSLAATQTFTIDGTVTTAGTLTNTAGVIILAGTLAGAGTLALTGGVTNINNSAALTIAKVNESAAAANVNIIASNLTVSDVWTQTAGTINANAGDRINFTGVGDTFNATLAGAGTVAFTGGTDLISGAHLTATTQIINGATVTLSGTVTETTSLTATTPALTIATAGATLAGGGSIALSNVATNAIVGATSAATLTILSGKVSGAGNLGNGSMVLVNQAGGVVNGSASNGLTINTGAATITNAGVIENTGAGGTTVLSAVNNTGTFLVTTGVLKVQGAVTGAGTAKITGGTAEFGSTFTENVTFSSTTGVLELAKSTAYTGSITGFSKTGTTSLDLLDIAFGGSTKATFSGTTASGVLTVTDGTHTAKITLIGNFTASVFTPSSDGHGGTTVVDPTVASTGRTPPMQPLVSAMAGFGAGSVASGADVAAAPRLAYVALARPA